MVSYGILRLQKFTAGSCRGIEIHDLRKKKGVSNTNLDINWLDSYKNYDLCPEKNTNFYATCKNKIAKLNLKKAVRKDAIVMSQFLVTSDSDFFNGITPAEQEQFFLDSYNFIANRYGAENIVSAIVHLDEKTPHMHINLVPITPDGRLSAKKLFTRTSLSQLQTDFFNSVGEKYGLERGIVGSKAKHKKSEEFKLDTFCDNAKKIIDFQTKKINENDNKIADQEESLAYIRAEAEKQNLKLEEYINRLQDSVNYFRQIYSEEDLEILNEFIHLVNTGGPPKSPQKPKYNDYYMDY